mmetsp:Transcript_37561/g.57537  ORF Transcript_37561/g.57537 Transcript_37561/m.57537 type:complete len:153 (-) Transcript_37561:4138-4596(-)
MLSRHPSQELVRAIEGEELSLKNDSDDRNVVIKISQLAVEPGSHSGSSTEEVHYFEDSKIFLENEARRSRLKLSDDDQNDENLLAPDSPALQLELSSVSDAFRLDKEIKVVELDDFSNWKHSDDGIEVNLKSPFNLQESPSLHGSDEEKKSS